MSLNELSLIISFITLIITIIIFWYQQKILEKNEKIFILFEEKILDKLDKLD
jgi:hypothetical protein